MWWEQKGHLTIRNNLLFVGNRCVIDLAKEHGTPLYIYNNNRVRENFATLKNALESAGFRNSRIHYAMKANNHVGVLKAIRELGGLIDATSPGEVSLALKLGFRDSDIIFTGTSLSDSDLDYLADTDVLINFDSISSLKRFKSKRGRRVGLRINTAVGLGRSPMVTTGGTITEGLPVKFGLYGKKVIQAIDTIMDKGLELYCLHHHVGSDWGPQQIDKYLLALRNLLEMVSKIRSSTSYEIPVLDLGGGFGVPHSETENIFPVHDFFNSVSKIINESTLDFSTIVIEPGNFLVADAGILVTQVNTIEQKNDHLFIGVDAGLNVFNSPSLYGFYHEIVSCNRCLDKQTQVSTVAGNICEPRDLFGINRKLPKIREGDYIAILNAGAYGRVMCTEYNLRPKGNEVLIE